MKILWFRPDSIGDAVLASSMLPYVYKYYNEKYNNDVEITVFCQEHIKELYLNNSYVDHIITFDKIRIRKDKENYTKELINILNNRHFDLILNSVYSRDPLTDGIVNCNAREKIGFIGDTASGMTERMRQNYSSYYTRLIPVRQPYLLELNRHKEFLEGLGIKVNERRLSPVIYLDKESRNYADDFIIKNKINPKKLIILFAGVQVPVRKYEHYGDAIDSVIDRNYTVIALGDKSDEALNQKNLDCIKVTKKKFNLSGYTTILEGSALIEKCKLVVGAETGLAHIACALNIPNIVILGGGHYGRFMPYSNSSYIIDNKMDCYVCNWLCRKPNVECIVNIKSEKISEGMRKAMKDIKERDSKKECIILATSIAPGDNNAIDNQRKAIKSWQDRGFNLLSFNTEEELEILSKQFPEVNFVVVKNSGKEKYGKPYPLLKDILNHFYTISQEKDCSDYIYGIANADIFLKDDIKDFIQDNIYNSLLFGCRSDVKDLTSEKNSNNYYKCGFDYFFFDKNLLEIFHKADINLYMGLQWWDYILPLLALNAEKEIKRIVSPVVLHKNHEASQSSISTRRDTFIDFMSIISKNISLPNTFKISNQLLNHMLDKSQLMAMPLKDITIGHKPPIAAHLVSSGMDVKAESNFAKELRNIIIKNKFTNILETGTYLGMGTTSIIASALKEIGTKDHNFYSIEANPDYFKQANMNLTKNGLKNFVHLINGYSVPSYLLPSKEEIFKTCIKDIEDKNIIVDHNEEDRIKFYYDEINLSNDRGIPYNRMEIALEKMNNKPNVILLDSSGCMGFIEFKYLMSLLKWACYIVLDDTKHVKHYQSLEYIKQDPRFDWLHESDEKFGFCIARYIG